jgi:tetratricopeptide (TPR) repeat protein
VAPSSAALDWGEPAEIQVRLEATHTAICKFEEKNEMYKVVEENICELLTWSTDTAFASADQIQRCRWHPDDRGPLSDPAALTAPRDDLLDGHSLLGPGLALKSRNSSVGSLSGASAEEANLVRPPNSRSSSSTWLDRLSGLRPLFKTSSATPSETQSTRSNDSPADSKSILPIRMLPHPRPSSTIRRAQLFESLLAASGGGPVALHGIGGVGKTQLAVRLAYWFLDRDPEFSVIWIHAASVETCAEGLRTLAERCGIVNPQEDKSVSDQHPRKTSLVELLASVRKWLQKAPAHKWLIVFDSADDVDALTTPLIDPVLLEEGDDAQAMSIIDCIPSDGFVVFTTKSRAAAGKFSQPQHGTMLEVGRFAVEEATLMLEIALNDDLLMGTPIATQQRSLTLEFGNGAIGNKILSGARQYRTDRASELAERLDCLPLAISQAAAFMNKNGLSTADYLSRISASSDEMLAELMARPQPLDAQLGVPKSIYDTWRLSYESIRNHNRLAADVLAFMSFLEQNSIILDLLRAAFSAGQDVKLVDALGELRDYELIHAGSTKDIFTMHRLVQATTQKWLKESKLDVQWARAVLMTIAEKFPIPDNIPSWLDCAAWLPHANKILRCPLFGTAADSAALATLHLKVGCYYFQTGRWSEARTATEAACNIRAEILGPLEPATLEAKDQFIQVVRQLGQFNLAEATARDVKRYRKRKLGRKHELTLKSYRMLGLTLQDQGQYADAMRCSEKAMKGFRDLYGTTDPVHPDILLSAYRLGAMYEMTGDFSKSEVFLSEALQGLKQRGEGESYHASQVLYRLSYLQRGLGKYRESEKTAFASMEMRRKLLGPDHPDTMKAYFSTGWSMQCQERYEESADVFTEVIKACKKKIGDHHAYTYTASYYLAESLRGLGEYEQAKRLHEQVLAGRKKALRNNHPDVLTSQVGLSSALLILGNSGKSEELTLEVYNILKKEGKITKERAPIAWMCMSNMAKIHAERAATAKTELEKQSQWKEAIKWGRRLVEGQERIIGSKHPETIKASQQLMGYLNASGERKAASGILETMSSVTLGEDDESLMISGSKSVEEKPTLPKS